MTYLFDTFDTKDLLTVATVEQAKVGTKGYFGDNLSNLIEKVRQGKVETLTDVMPNEAYCFGINSDSYYIFFLPADKVKEKVKEPVYRPIKTIDELFNFLIPDFDADTYTYNTYEKADVTLLKVYELKGKLTGNICYRRFSQIYISDNYIRLDEYNSELLFKMYEIKKDGEWVPFGIKE